MKTFAHKLKLSLVAMFCGWVVCNILFWICNLSWMVDRYKFFSDYIGYLIFMGVCTGVVIMCAWLVIFFPVDVWVSDNSRLRRPWIASICGFVAGAAVTVVLWPYFAGAGWLAKVTSMKFSLQDMPYVRGPSITGMVAAFSRSLIGKTSAP
ncbi:MAG: hypothetical protein J0L73_04880 [Verrucomicrobia bacterium]|nr:hypothetical protein [Verrucomicrobiota bacterium]